VQREVARLVPPSSAATTPRAPAAKPMSQADASKPAPRASRAAVEVDRYFDQQNTNPLFRKKGSKE